jgi:type I restriction enzyme R subunit
MYLPRLKTLASILKDMFYRPRAFGNDCKVITHGEPKSRRIHSTFFVTKEERLPQIAISVDMLDTGIDNPLVACNNVLQTG